MVGHGNALDTPEEVAIWEVNPAASCINPAGKAKVGQLGCPTEARWCLAAAGVCWLAQQDVLGLEVQMSYVMGVSMCQARGNPMHEAQVLQLGLSPQPNSGHSGREARPLTALHHSKLIISLTDARSADGWHDMPYSSRYCIASGLFCSQRTTYTA